MAENNKHTDLLEKEKSKLAILEDDIKARKQEILDNVDIDEMMMNPKVYLRQMAREFYDSNGDKFEKAVTVGKTLAGKMLKATGYNNNEEDQGQIDDQS